MNSFILIPIVILLIFVIFIYHVFYTDLKSNYDYLKNINTDLQLRKYEIEKEINRLEKELYEKDIRLNNKINDLKILNEIDNEFKLKELNDEFVKSNLDINDFLKLKAKDVIIKCDTDILKDEPFNPNFEGIFTQKNESEDLGQKVKLVNIDDLTDEFKENYLYKK